MIGPSRPKRVARLLCSVLTTVPSIVLGKITDKLELMTLLRENGCDAAWPELERLGINDVTSLANLSTEVRIMRFFGHAYRRAFFGGAGGALTDCFLFLFYFYLGGEGAGRVGRRAWQDHRGSGSCGSQKGAPCRQQAVPCGRRRWRPGGRCRAEYIEIVA